MPVDTSHIKGNGKEEFSAQIHKAGEAISEAARVAKDTAGSVSEQMLDELKVQSKELRERSKDYIQKKPLVALGGAALVGFVLALIMRRH